MTNTTLAVCSSCGQERPHYLRKGSRAGQVLGLCLFCRKERSLAYYRRQSAESPEFREKQRLKKKRQYAKNPCSSQKAKNPVQYYSVSLMANTRYRAKRMGVEHTITKDWLVARLQVGLCEATGLPFDMGRSESTHCNPRVPSIDRIDSTKGYTPENCQVVMVWYNVAKNDYIEDDILELMRAVVKNKTS